MVEGPGRLGEISGAVVHVEFASMLSSLLEEMSYSSDVDADLKLGLFHSPGFKVGECPETVDGFVCSDVALALSKSIGVRKSSSQKIARNIVARATDEATLLGDNFALSEEGGFVNAVPRQSFVDRFLNALLFTDVEEFLRLDTLVTGKTGAGSPRECIDCFSASKRASEKWALMEDLDLRDVTMSLALAGDGELDSDSYFRGAPECENIPWYLERFVLDSAKFLNEMHLHSGCVSHLPSEVFVDLTTLCGLRRGASGAGAWLKLLLGFRHCVSNANARGRGELAFGQCLELIRAFYTSLHRALVTTPTGVDSISAVARFAAVQAVITRKIVKQYLLLLRSTCALANVHV